METAKSQLIELNKIYNEDCLEGMKRIPDNSIDYTFTSPPYNRKRNDKYNNHDDSRADWFEFMSDTIDELKRITRKHIFFNVQKNYYNKNDVFKLIGKYSESIVEIIIWNKTNPMPASGNSITNSYEFIIVLGDGALKSNTTYTKNVITTNVYSKNPYREVHRAVMHPELAKEVLTKFVQKGNSVLDPFMGVGTTAIACIESGMSFTGFELEKEYYDIAKERIENHEKED